MKNNENGFTYPFTLCLLIIFFSFFSVQTEQFLSESKMAHEKNTILQGDYYFLSSVKRLEGIFQKSGTLPSKGTISFINSTMDYQAEAPTGYVQKVNFTLHLAGDKTAIGRGFFDTRTKKLTKWVN